MNEKQTAARHASGCSTTHPSPCLPVNKISLQTYRMTNIPTTKERVIRRWHPPPYMLSPSERDKSFPSRWNPIRAPGINGSCPIRWTPAIWDCFRVPTPHPLHLCASDNGSRLVVSVTRTSFDNGPEQTRDYCQNILKNNQEINMEN